MPRVIGGSSRGIPLLTPKGMETRPTADKVKEALFSILQTRMDECSFLDLFSGSGQVGIEAASRGAKEAVLLESSPKALAIIRKNIEKARLSDKVHLMGMDVFRGLDELGRKKQVFDIIYMDPPYDLVEDFLKKTAALVAKYNLLKPGGLLIVEHKSTDSLEQNVINLTFSRRCKYGMTMITFYTT